MALRLQIGFPPIPDGNPQNVVKQQFGYVVNGGTMVGPNNFEPSVTSDQIAPIEDNAAVDLSMDWVDKDGNSSAVHTQSIIAKNDIPPDAPGDFGGVTVLSNSEPDGPPVIGGTPVTPAMAAKVMASRKP